MKKEMKTHSRKHDGIDAIHQLKQPITLPLIFELFPPIIAIFCRIVSSFLCRSRRSWHDWPRFVPRFLFALWSKESTELIINGRKWTHKLSIYSYVHRTHCQGQLCRKFVTICVHMRKLTTEYTEYISFSNSAIHSSRWSTIVYGFIHLPKIRRNACCLNVYLVGVLWAFHSRKFQCSWSYP